MAFAHLIAGRYQEAATTMVQRNPKTIGTHLILAPSYPKLGRPEDAKTARDIVLAAEPQTSIAQANGTEPFERAEDLQHYLELRRAAGFPKESPTSP